MAFRNEFTELMNQSMYDWFFEEYERHTPMYPKLFKVEELKTGYKKSTTGIGMGQLSERPEGDDIVMSKPVEGWSPIHKARTFSDSFELTQEFVEDAPAEKVGDLLKALALTWGEGVVASKEKFAAKFFNYGGYTAGHDVFNGTITGVIDDPSGDLCYDGKPFFNLTGNNRTAKNGSTYYNGTANAFSATNLKTSYLLMSNTNAYDEKGDKIVLLPSIILHPPALKFTVKEVLANTDTANLRSSVENIVTPMEWAYLTDSDAWFLGVPQKGITWYERKAPVIDFYQNEVNKKYYATIDARWGAGVSNWRYWQGNAFSTS